MRSVLLCSSIIMWTSVAAAGNTCPDPAVLTQQFPNCVAVDAIYAAPGMAQGCPCQNAAVELKKEPSELSTPAMTGVTTDTTFTIWGTMTGATTCTINWVDSVAIKMPPGCTP